MEAIYKLSANEIDSKLISSIKKRWVVPRENTVNKARAVMRHVQAPSASGRPRAALDAPGVGQPKRGVRCGRVGAAAGSCAVPGLPTQSPLRAVDHTEWGPPPPSLTFTPANHANHCATTSARTAPTHQRRRRHLATQGHLSRRSRGESTPPPDCDYPTSNGTPSRPPSSRPSRLPRAASTHSPRRTRPKNAGARPPVHPTRHQRATQAVGRPPRNTRAQRARASTATRK